MLTAMTFNLRFENDRDGENGWQFRKELVLDLIRHYRPALLGTQEGTTAQLRYLQENLPDYRLLAPGRYWDAGCQYCSIFFRSHELRPLSGGDLWLSATPHIHRSIGWDSAFPRMISHGVMEEIASGRVFWVGVTHLDHIGKEARKKQAEIIRDLLSEEERPKILLGDFNDRPGSTAHQLLTSTVTGMRDTWEALSRPEDDSSMTYHGFLGVPRVCRMDWILVSRDFGVSDARVVSDHGPENRYPSDHFPYMVWLAWT
ncbi:MAG: endonuclease/exonuclease/phosphatase family protein [Syntrophobacteraceae bacterium]